MVNTDRAVHGEAVERLAAGDIRDAAEKARWSPY